MSFFTPTAPKAKLQSLDRHLSSQLHDIHQARWSGYLTKTELAVEHNVDIARTPDVMAQFQIPAGYRDKANFCWESLFESTNDGDPGFIYLNSKLQYEHYHALFNL